MCFSFLSFLKRLVDSQRQSSHKFEEIVLIIGKAHKLHATSKEHIHSSRGKSNRVSSLTSSFLAATETKIRSRKSTIHFRVFSFSLFFGACAHVYISHSHSLYVCVWISEWNSLDSSRRNMIEMLPSHGRINIIVWEECVCVCVRECIQRNSFVILTSFNCDCHRFDNFCLLFLMTIFFKPAPFFSFFILFRFVFGKKNFRSDFLLLFLFLTENGN